ncbi:MAG: SurA N-terminal domain-containing protein [Cognatishimia activa]
MSQKSSISNKLVWVLMGLLILSLGGFGITNLGGTINNVGTVDGKPIAVTTYSRAVQQELTNLSQQTGQQITFQQAQLFGLNQQVLGRLVTQRALDAEAERLGLSIGDENVRDELLSIPAFQGLDGNFDREAYAFTLDSAGLNEGEFEQSLREGAATTLLQTAVTAGVQMPATYADTILSYLGETRDFTMAVLTEANLPEPIAAPDEASLQAYYDANTDQFLRPATRDITYAWLTPDMILDTVEVDETAVRALYDDRSAEFNQPERRLVERLVMGSTEEAQAAIDAIAAGTESFEATVEARGLSLADVDLGDVTQESLGAAGDVVFGAASGQTVGPVDTDLGPAIYRINGILNAQSTSFEDAQAELRAELAGDRARRVIDAQINDIDDLLAGGATIEELATETEMQVATINWHAGLSDGIAGYEEFRAQAVAVAESDFPAIENLADGGIFAIRLDGETEASPAPFVDAKADVEAAWRAQAVGDALQSLATDYVSQMAAGADIISLGVTVLQETDIARGDFIPDVPATLVETVFGMDLGGVATVADGQSVAVVELDAINAADLAEGEADSLRGILTAQVNQTFAQEILNAYSTQIRLNADVQIDQNAVNAVHSHLQ